MKTKAVLSRTVKAHKLVALRGALSEPFPWEIHFDFSAQEEAENEPPCPHCHSRKSKSFTRGDGSEYSIAHWVCPRVVVAWNEGGYAPTYVCLDCILAVVNQENLMSHEGEVK